MIDKLVDSTTVFEFLSALDVNLGYPQIFMYLEIWEDFFHYIRKNFLLQSNPFGLKNKGVTYRQMVNKVCKHYTRRNMKAYMETC
jgi:hypothetical protein